MLKTERLLLKLPTVADADILVDYYRRNKAFLSAFEPEREDFFYTRAYQKMLIQASVDAHLAGTELRYWLFLKEEPERAIGTVGFSNMVMGPFLSCFLGYKLDGEHLRQGFMQEALEMTIPFVFEAYGLHRIEANVMPRNKPSLALLEKLGFYNEGLAIKYLKINGIWEDHIHMVKRNALLE